MARTAELETANRIDAGLGERMDDLLIVLAHDLRLEDQHVVRVVDPEAVRNVTRPRDELHRPAGDERLRRVDRPRKLDSGDAHELRMRPRALAVGDVED